MAICTLVSFSSVFILRDLKYCVPDVRTSNFGYIGNKFDPLPWGIVKDSQTKSDVVSHLLKYNKYA